MADIMIKTGSQNDLAATIVKILAEQKRSIKFRVFPKMLSNYDIDQLELSPRSYNCIRRTGYETVGALAEHINGITDLMSIRNLGIKSAQEVMFRLFLLQQSVLDQERREQYLKEVIELNHLDGKL